MPTDADLLPLYFHVDMDAFYISVELLQRPELRGRPVVVGGARDARGVVASASYEARRFGVHSAMPTRTAARLCPEAVFLPPRFDLYREYSSRVEAVLHEFSPRVEMASVDEAYLDLSGCRRLHGPPLAAAQKLRETVLQRTGLPCSIGAAGSRMVSKVASDWAKPRGLLWILPGEEAAFLAPLPVGKLPGVGRVTAESLAHIGIYRVADLQRTSDELLRQRVGSWGPPLRQRALGIDRRDDSRGAGTAAFVVNDDSEDGHSISHEITFAQDTDDLDQLQRALARMVEKVGSRLRHQQRFARTLHLKLRDSGFQTITRAVTLAEPTQLDSILLAQARTLFAAHYRAGTEVRLLGFGVTGLQASSGQLNLMEAEQRQRWSQALDAVDAVRQRFGAGAVHLAATLNRLPESPESPRDPQGVRKKTKKMPARRFPEEPPSS